MNEIEAKNEIIRVAHKMLNGSMNLLIGCRVITGFQSYLTQSEEEILMPFCVVDTEIDQWPLGVARDLCDSEYLKRVDDQIKCYLEIEAENIISACKKVIKKFSEQVGKS